MNAEVAAELCHRQRGIGADGIALVTLPSAHAARMRLFNADGSIPEMCGNALRCVVKHLHDLQVPHFGPALVDRHRCRDAVGDVRGRPESSPTHRHHRGHGTTANPGHSMRHHRTGPDVLRAYHLDGQPHFVVSSDDPPADAERFGRPLSVHPSFSEGCNISFARRLDTHRVSAVVYERGAGLPKLVARARVPLPPSVGIWDDSTQALWRRSFPGGTLRIDRASSGALLMTGPAVWVFDGNLDCSLIGPTVQPSVASILLVDGDTYLVRLYAEMLGKAGHTVDAVDKLQKIDPQASYDIALIELSDTGLQILERLKAKKRGPELLGIAKPAEPAMLQAALKLGVVDVLVKPIERRAPAAAGAAHARSPRARPRSSAADRREPAVARCAKNLQRRPGGTTDARRDGAVRTAVAGDVDQH